MKFRISTMTLGALLLCSAVAVAGPAEDGAPPVAVEDAAVEVDSSCDTTSTNSPAMTMLLSDTPAEVLLADVGGQGHCPFDPHCDSQLECTNLCGGRCFMNCCFCP